MKRPLNCSDYKSTRVTHSCMCVDSICLPLECLDTDDLAYLSTILLVNGAAFCLVCCCYGRMYCAVRNGNTLSRSDMTVAKRMASLVFTDFACWAPVAFFATTALAGFPLISVSHAKILLVFFYPLNSCANPYLYALLTRQYRRDLMLMLARYGLRSSALVVRQKGTAQPQRHRLSALEPPQQSQHRSSVLTAQTSLDLPTPPGPKQFIEMVPLPVVTDYSLSSKGDLSGYE